MNRLLIVAVMLILCIFICCPATAYSQAYYTMDKEKQNEFDANMKLADAAYKMGNYERAKTYYEQAREICPSDYYAISGIGQAKVSLGMQQGDQNEIASGYSALGSAAYILDSRSGVDPASYEYADMMAKIKREQARALAAQGDTAGAAKLEEEANQYREKADRMLGGSLPVSPLVVLAGIGLVAILYRRP